MRYSFTEEEIKKIFAENDGFSSKRIHHDKDKTWTEKLSIRDGRLISTTIGKSMEEDVDTEISNFSDKHHYILWNRDLLNLDSVM